VLDAIKHAIWTRRREGITDLSGLINHNDRGSSSVGIDASACANALVIDTAPYPTVLARSW